MKNTLLLLLLCSLIGSVNAAVINEIRVDQDGADSDEYIELAGTANESLDGLSLVVIGDGSSTTGQGVIEDVVNLDGFSFNSDGFFTLAEDTFFAGATADAVVDVNFENSQSTTFLLVTEFSGSNADDLDSNDDGTLDNEPWTAIVDSVAITSSAADDLEYSAVLIGPDEDGSSPEHVFLCVDGWRIGLDAFTADVDDDFDTPTLVNKCDDNTGGGPITERTIPEIQSDQAASPFAGERVRTTGVVTADFQGEDQQRGFYIQDPLGDGNDDTSDGIYVFEGNTPIVDVNVGDNVTIEADITEFFDLTELNAVTSIVINSSANLLPAPVEVVLPESVDGDLEKFEGMLVSISDSMTISQVTSLGRNGQLILSSADDNGVSGRLFQPTNQFAAGTPEVAQLMDENARRVLVLDDAKNGRTDPVSYLGTTPEVIRAGDRVIDLVGVLDYGLVDGGLTRADYRLQPTQAPTFISINSRSNEPDISNQDLRVASFNVLNFFTTLNSRGADSDEELQRQEDKLLSALLGIDADVVGLVEIENNGLGAGSAIRRLVDAINRELGSIEYEVLPVDGLLTPIGSDQITVAFIYKPASVVPVGRVATLDTGAFDSAITDGGRSRQPVAASFEEVESGEIFTAVINHFKSKRPPSTVQNNGNDDQGDGQASWNLRRTEAANDLADWLATDPTEVDDPDVLILGDLNAYAKEDPILALAENGYIDLVDQFEGSGAGYSFAFGAQSGYLDHALGTAELSEQVSDVTTWHINSDEPTVLDYNQESNPEAYYQANPFRSSDHDPVIVSLSLKGEDELEEDTCFVIKAANSSVVQVCL